MKDAKPNSSDRLPIMETTSDGDEKVVRSFKDVNVEGKGSSQDKSEEITCNPECKL
jgi:hypothetical protein